MSLDKKRCRICKGKFFPHNSINYKNMPSAAQNFPNKNNLNKDKGINLIIYQCSNCGVVQLINKPVEYYREVIRSSAFSSEMLKFRTLQFKKIIKKYNLKGKKIIEIGSGYGEYLSILNNLKLQTSGLEFSNKGVRVSRKKNLNVSQGYIDKIQYKLDKAPFDAFFIFSYLEHLPNINTVLKALNRNLNKNGIGIIEVPNFNLIFKEKLFAEFIRDHLYYFTKESLSTTCNINGFEVIDTSYVWHDYIISAVVKKSSSNKLIQFKKAKPINLKNFVNQKDKVKKDIKNYLKKFNQKKIIVWGAGHQALTFISLTNLSKKISFIVDSAPFKQGKFCPDTGLRVVSPDHLAESGINVLFLSLPGVYATEVVESLRARQILPYRVFLIEGNELFDIS